jgi:hypothetical protein
LKELTSLLPAHAHQRKITAVSGDCLHVLLQNGDDADKGALQVEVPDALDLRHKRFHLEVLARDRTEEIVIREDEVEAPGGEQWLRTESAAVIQDDGERGAPGLQDELHREVLERGNPRWINFQSL